MSSNEKIKNFIEKLNIKILMLQLDAIHVDDERQRIDDEIQRLQKEFALKENATNSLKYISQANSSIITLTLFFLSFSFLIWNLFDLKFIFFDVYTRLKLIYECVTFKKSNDSSKDKCIDRVANYNVKMFILEQRMYVNKYLFRNSSSPLPALQMEKNNQTNKRRLKKCGGGCGRELAKIKSEGESFKITECGHVICTSCVNRCFKIDLHCPVCNHGLKRNGIIRITNLYL
jgi:hypothetical protein